MSVILSIGAGIVLIILETILPGMIAGISGTVLMGVGVFLSYRDYGSGVGTGVLLGSIAALVIVGMLWIKYFPQSIFARIFISDRTIGGDAGEELPELVGKEGEAVTRLYSCGKVRVDGQLLDALTAGEGIEKGAKIRIVHVEGMKIVVEEIK